MNNSANRTTIVVGGEMIWVPFGISVFGLVGNFAAFFTILLSDLRKNYVNVYLLVLLVSDSVLLLDLFLQPPFRFDVINFWTCAATEFVFNTCIYVSSFSIMSLTAERFFSILFPLQHLKRTHMSRWKLVLWWLVPVVAFNFNVLLALKGTEMDSYIVLVASSSGRNVQCEYDYAGTLPYALFYWPRLLFTFLLPSAVVVFANLAIVVKLRAINIVQGQSSSSEVKANNKLLFVIPAVYIALNLPYSVRGDFIKFLFPSLEHSSIFEEHLLLVEYTFFPYCCNFAVNFVIYAITSPLFRKALVQVWLAMKPFNQIADATRTNNMIQTF